MVPFVFTVFLGALLLFGVQPMIGKYILPWFGGSPGVWTACLAFFQLQLLAGYLYAHVASSWLSARAERMGHWVLVAVTLLFLPIVPQTSWQPGPTDLAAVRILGLLAATIGLPYLLLASTSPLVQRWYGKSRPTRSPYPLFAWSNAGSLAALLGYPLVVEPMLTLRTQIAAWSVLYVAYAASFSWCAFAGTRSADAVDTGSNLAVGRGRMVVWFVLAAVGCLFLVGTTNQMCQDVAAVPLLWVVPLALYLLSFIVVFSTRRLYRRGAWSVLLILALASVLYVLYRPRGILLLWQIAAYSSALFVGCVVCHGELARTRPPPARLTSFYLSIAAGGAAGGLFASLAAPFLFERFWEYPLALALVPLVLLLALYRDPHAYLFAGEPRWMWYPLSLVYALWVAALAAPLTSDEPAIETSRTFYGVLRVIEHRRSEPDAFQLRLLSGRITHGAQFVPASKRVMPTLYYGTSSGIGIAMARHPRRRAGAPLAVAVIGLGTGTIAALAGASDQIRFYEIDPEVERLARQYFTFLDGRSTDIVLGDARRSLARERDAGQVNRFDILAVDAFSGDAIPVHLLTREAFALYLAVLKPDGVLAVHISNQHLDLGPVVRGLAEERSLRAGLIHDPGDDALGTTSSTWVLVSANEALWSDVEIFLTGWLDPAAPPVIWTDDYSNILDVLIF